MSRHEKLNCAVAHAHEGETAIGSMRAVLLHLLFGTSTLTLVPGPVAIGPLARKM